MTAEAREAIEALDFCLGYAGGWMPMWSRRDESHDGRWWHRCGTSESARLLVENVSVADERWSHEVAVGIPQRKRWAGVTAATVLWCRIEGKDQLKRARAFRPLPTLVLQEGSSSRRLLIWALEERLGYFEVVELNRRIAYRLGAVQKHADPDALMIPAPGTFLRVGRSRPAPVLVARLTTDTYLGAQVAGRLKDPPEVKWEGGTMTVNGRPVTA